MNDKFEITVTKKIMKNCNDVKSSCNVCSISDDNRQPIIYEIKFRQIIISLCKHHKDILLKKLSQ